MSQSGAVISFYSYKGGVGRTLATANIGQMLASSVRMGGERVLLVDFELEAPGLHVFFTEGMTPAQRKAPGVMEYFEALVNRLQGQPSRYAQILEDRRVVDEILPLEPYIQCNVLPGLDLMLSSPGSKEYRKRVTEFNWAATWHDYPAAIHAFRESLERRY